MRTRIITALALLLGVAAATVATPAAAAPSPRFQHCVADLETRAVSCASTEQKARTQAGVAAGSLVIARIYDGTGHSGASFTWTQSRPCTSSYDSEWQWDNLSNVYGYNWNNRISSVHTYNQCDVRLFDGYNFTGAASTWIDYSPNLANIGIGWSNKAGSIKFS